MLENNFQSKFEWTEYREAQLRSLWSMGISASKIAGIMGGGVTRNAVIGKAHRLGLSKRPSPIKRFRSTQSVGIHQCQWPIGNPGEKGFHFCGDKAVVGRPYCAGHCSIAYRRMRPDMSEAAE